MCRPQGTLPGHVTSPGSRYLRGEDLGRKHKVERPGPVLHSGLVCVCVCVCARARACVQVCVRGRHLAVPRTIRVKRTTAGRSHRGRFHASAAEETVTGSRGPGGT